MEYSGIRDSDGLVERLDSEIRALVPNYLRRRADEVEKLKGLLRDGDYVSIKEIGHNLKGTGFGFGFQILTDLGERLETAALHNLPEDIEGIISRLDSVVHELIAHL